MVSRLAQRLCGCACAALGCMLGQLCSCSFARHCSVFGVAVPECPAENDARLWRVKTLLEGGLLLFWLTP